MLAKVGTYVRTYVDGPFWRYVVGLWENLCKGCIIVYEVWKFGFRYLSYIHIVYIYFHLFIL